MKFTNYTLSKCCIKPHLAKESLLLLTRETAKAKPHGYVHLLSTIHFRKYELQMQAEHYTFPPL
jgi:hypothetical protein